MPGPGDRIGKYEVLVKLGEGGMGEVWKARDTELDRTVALKFLKSGDAEELARFRREALTAARLNHPNIAKVYEARENYIAMQLIEGSNLAQTPRGNPRQAAGWIRSAARALHQAHGQQVIHRDLKPGNLMLDRDGQLYVLDFGLAKQTSVESSLSVSGMVLGTPAYMPPEQARGETHRVDARSDVYSLGATLYTVLSDRRPFDADNALETLRQVTEEEPTPLRRIDPMIPRDLDTIIQKCMEKDPNRRYGNAEELADDLGRFLDGEPIFAHPPSTFYRLRKKLAKRRGVVTVGSLGLIAVGVVIGLFVPRWLEERKEREENQERLAAQERARPHVEGGRRQLDRARRILWSDDWTRDKLLPVVEEARSEFRRAFGEVRDHPEAWLGIARTHALLGEWNRAREACTNAVRSSPGFASAYLERAMIGVRQYEEQVHTRTGTSRQETEETENLRKNIDRDFAEVRKRSKDPSELKYAEGMMAFCTDDFGTAGDRLQAYAKEIISDPEAWFWAGHAWFHAGDLRKAIDAFSESLRYRPLEATTLMLRAMALQKVGMQAESELDFDRALGLEPDSINMRIGRADARFKQGKFREALVDYEHVADLFPDHADAHLGRGNALGMMQRYEEGVDAFRRCLSLNPRSWKGRMGLGTSLRALKRFPEAMKVYEDAIRHNPDNSDGYRERAALWESMGRRREAWDDYEIAVGKNPDEPELRHRRGLFLRDESFNREKAGDREAARNIRGLAVAEFTRAIKTDPKGWRHWDERGRIHMFLLDHESAERDLSRAIELGGTRDWVYYNRGLTRVNLKRWRSAIEDFTALLKRNPRYLNAYVQRAVARSAVQDLGGAIEDLKAALALAPKDWPLRAEVESNLRRLEKN